MTEEAIEAVINNVNWEEYYNYVISPFEGTDEEFSKLPLIYDSNVVEENFLVDEEL